jgi:hypothetical protein
MLSRNKHSVLTIEMKSRVKIFLCFSFIYRYIHCSTKSLCNHNISLSVSCVAQTVKWQDHWRIGSLQACSGWRWLFFAPVYRMTLGRIWLRHCATIGNAAGLIPDGVIGFFIYITTCISANIILYLIDNLLRCGDANVAIVSCIPFEKHKKANIWFMQLYEKKFCRLFLTFYIN